MELVQITRLKTLNYDLVEKQHESSLKEKRRSSLINMLRLFFRYLSIISLTILHGYNHVSSNNVMNRATTLYANNFIINNMDIATSLPPFFFFLGGFISILMMFQIKYSNYNKILMMCCIGTVIPYLVTMFYPHIYMIYSMKVFIGFLSGIMSLLLPQIFYSLGSGVSKNFTTALFPCFLLTGLALSVALIPSSVEYYYLVNSIPILLACIGLISLPLSTSFIKEQTDEIEEGSKTGLYKFLTSPKTMKSAVLIIAIQCSYRMTGVDFIGLFSSTLFTGEYAHLYSLLPLIIPIFLLLISGKIPDWFGRKNTYVFGLFFLMIPCLSFFLNGINFYNLPVYIFILDLFCCSVPYTLPNEIVEHGYQAIANELACVMIYFLSILVTLYIALTFVKGSTAVWLTFGISCFIFAVILTIIMKETLSAEAAYKFVDNWNNNSSWKRLCGQNDMPPMSTIQD